MEVTCDVCKSGCDAGGKQQVSNMGNVGSRWKCRADVISSSNNTYSHTFYSAVVSCDYHTANTQRSRVLITKRVVELQ